MEKPVLITIVGTQRFAGDEPDTIELVTHGTYRYEPGCITLSYVETEMTGLEGTVTTFTIEDGVKATLRRTGKIDSTMVFVLGRRDDSLYDTGFGTLMISVCAKQMTVLLNERGGIFDLLAGGIYFIIAVVYKLAYRNKRIAFFLKIRENSVERVGRIFYIVVKEYN